MVGRPARPVRLARVGGIAALVALALVILCRQPAVGTLVRRAVYTLPDGRLQRAAARGVGLLAATDLLPLRRLPAPPPMTVGINAPAIAHWATSFPFANLAIGSAWVDTQWTPLPEAAVDGSGAVLSLPAGAVARRFVSLPPTGPAGVEVQCRYAGSGVLGLAGAGQVLAAGPGSLRFHVVNPRNDPRRPYLVLTGVDARRPFRGLDCRDARLAPGVRFRPEFLATMRGYGVVRFMDWQNANANAAVTWATRHLPGGNRSDGDGVAIEDMLALASALGADPWFVVPWNADADYVARFARLVRAGLPHGRHVYVEVGNEVWNHGFPVARQAVAEGLARGLGSDPRTAGLRRYAQRTGEVMRLWEAAFAGRTGLVRVLSTQNAQPQAARTALAFGDTATHVDALATAPYFGDTYAGTANTRADVLARLSTAVPAALALATENRRVAADYGKRYLAYESGEALALPDQPLLAGRLQYDPAQYALVRRYLAGWQSDVGDVLCLLTSAAPVAPSGAWGLSVWEDEAPAAAPKLRAVRDAMGAR